MIKERFNTEQGWLESEWTGKISLNDIVEYIQRTKENTAYPRKLRILTHAENSSLNLSINDLHRISSENKLSLKNYEFIADAFIVDQAIVAALSSLYENVSQIKTYHFKIFSTLDAAKEWLMMY